uniref:RdRp catalytic domain-containing protein n=1 Tax=viral metagenome TaxID=1070528 RepID=A0A2V0RK69_9ZZZZ
MSTISNRNSEFVKRFLSNLQIDNIGRIERKLAPKLRKEVLPLARKLLRTSSIPSGLQFQEDKYLERVEWPRSTYKYSVLVEQSNAFANVPPGDELFIDDRWSHPWKQSAAFSFDLSLGRNRRSLPKGGSLPNGGSKRDNLAEAELYNEQKIKPNPHLENCYSIMPGVRTQQSHPDDPKVRLVWGTPTHWWMIECEAFDSALTYTIEAAGKADTDIFVFYTEPSKLQEWTRNHYSSVNQWVNLDASQFDASVTASEIKQMVEYFCGNYEFKELVKEYLVSAALVMPEGDLTRSGGQPSGSKTTNLFDGFCNVFDVIESFKRYKLDRFIQCICVNGDDITIGLDTKLTKDNLEKISQASRRNIHPDKSVTGEYLWNSKLYVDESLMTRPVFRVLNSLMFSERMKSSVYGSKEYIEIATAQQLMDIEQHPFGPDIIKAVAGISKYHISSMPDEQLQEAAEAYLDAHSWKEGEVSDMLSSIRSSTYGQIGS